MNGRGGGNRINTNKLRERLARREGLIDFGYRALPPHTLLALLDLAEAAQAHLQSLDAAADQAFYGEPFNASDQTDTQLRNALDRFDFGAT